MDRRETPVGRVLAKVGLLDDDEPKADSATKATRGFIYFIQMDRDGPIKVGWALDPEKRLATLQTGCPWDLRLLYFRPGSPADERAIHRRLKGERVRGEWFRESKPLYGEMYGTASDADPE